MNKYKLMTGYITIQDLARYFNMKVNIFSKLDRLSYAYGKYVINCKNNIRCEFSDEELQKKLCIDKKINKNLDLYFYVHDNYFSNKIFKYYIKTRVDK